MLYFNVLSCIRKYYRCKLILLLIFDQDFVYFCKLHSEFTKLNYDKTDQKSNFG